MGELGQFADVGVGVVERVAVGPNLAVVDGAWAVSGMPAVVDRTGIGPGRRRCVGRAATVGCASPG